MKIIIDAFGGDNAPLAAIKGAILAKKEFNVDITLVGDEEKIKEVMQFCEKKGYQIGQKFLIYILISHYRDEQATFDVFAQLRLKSLD